MSIEDLYNWAVENKVEKYECEIQYADGGGYYYGTRDLDNDISIDREKEVVVI